jgi:hypothetical protein
MALVFLTPHGSQTATTVAIRSPALPQGESYRSRALRTLHKNCRDVRYNPLSPRKWGEGWGEGEKYFIKEKIFFYFKSKIKKLPFFIFFLFKVFYILHYPIEL